MTERRSVPTDDELKQTLMATARLHHQLLTIVMVVIRMALLIGGIVVSVRIVEHFVS